MSRLTTPFAIADNDRSARSHLERQPLRCGEYAPISIDLPECPCAESCIVLMSSHRAVLGPRSRLPQMGDSFAPAAAHTIPA
jgi:hypothetical protein